MNAHTNVQIIHGPSGQPAFVVVPYADFIAEHRAGQGLIPNDVVSRTVDGATPLRAWREYLGLTQADVAKRLAISQPAYAQQENSQRLRKSSREKIAAALGITQEQLNF